MQIPQNKVYFLSHFKNPSTCMSVSKDDDRGILRLELHEYDYQGCHFVLFVPKVSSQILGSRCFETFFLIQYDFFPTCLACLGVNWVLSKPLTLGIKIEINRSRFFKCFFT